MMPNIPTLRLSCVAMAAAGALVGALAIPIGSAAAQTTYTTREEIIITPPYVQHREVGRSYSGVPVEELSLSRGVDISDLDLSRWDDVQMLDYRIRQAAYATCNELDRQYPDTLYPSYQSGDRDCVVKAIDTGRAQARLAVAQWSGGPRYAYAPPPYPYGE
ncbi:MAG TPA: UrcA family protein [Alphaproteobacteria bacterium]|jgi:UrcA family protein|nr:UrcA family protein [Alphaproteobacteria bacterium]